MKSDSILGLAGSLLERVFHVKRSGSQTKVSRARGTCLSLIACGGFLAAGLPTVHGFQTAETAPTLAETVANSTVAPQDETAASNSASIPASQQEQTIRFAFEDEQWSTVIEWFAEQVGLIVYTEYSGFPKGTFSNADGKDYSVKAALDQLNFYLSLQGYTLVRFGNRLIVIDHQTQGLPEELIPVVSETELDDRGEYEVVICKFNIAGLDYDALTRQVGQLVKPPRGKVEVLSISEELYVRETGRQLRQIRSLIDRAKTNAVIVYEARTLKHIPFPQLMQLLRPQFGIRENENRLEDGSLAISLLNSETRPWISGTKDKVEKALKLIDALDIESNRPTGLDVEGYEVKYYSPKTDPELVQRILLDFFSGRSDVRMSRSEESDTLYIKARPSDHVEIEDLIKKLESNAIVFEKIMCHDLTPSEMVLKLKTALGISTSILEETESTGPSKNIIFMEEFDCIFVRGTQRLVTEVKIIAEKLDPTPVEGEVARTPYRILENVDEESVDGVIDLFQGVWETTGGPAPLEWRRPSDRRGGKGGGGAGPDSGIRFPSFDRQFGEGEFQKLNPENLSPEQLKVLFELLKKMQQGGSETERKASPDSNQEATPNSAPAESPRTTTPTQSYRSLSGRQYEVVELGRRPRSVRPAQNVYAVTTVQDVQDDQDDQEPAARPVRPEAGLGFSQESVPGDPIIMEMTPKGLMIRSKDLDALDMAERLLKDLSKEAIDTTDPTPARTVFLLGFRPATEIASEIEEILGIGGNGGGGGGGGMTDMLGNMAQNALGGAAGGMVGALMGGGLGGSSSSSSKTTGDVSIHVDNYLNALIVYANVTDTDEIDQLIDLKDRPSAPHDPRIYGSARSIKIKHHDPQIIKEQVDIHFASYLRKPEGQGGGGGQQPPNPEQMIRALMGGRGGRGGGGGSSEPAKPMISVSVDVEAKLLLVKGPENLIEEVEQFVSEMDYEGVIPEIKSVVMELPQGVTADQVSRLMSDLFGAGTQTQQRPGQQPGQNAGGQGGGQNQGGGMGANADALRAFGEAVRQRMGEQGGRQPGSSGGRESSGGRDQSGGGRSRSTGGFPGGSGFRGGSGRGR